MEFIHSFQCNVNTKLILQHEALRVTDTGKTQKDGLGREVGGGSGWGTHVHPWLIHVNVWQKTTTIL